MWWLGELAAHPLAYAEHRFSYIGKALTSGASAPGSASPLWSRVGVLGGPMAFNAPSNAAEMRTAAQGRVPPSYFQPWHDETMPLPLAILALAMFWVPRFPAVAFLICLPFAAATLRQRARGVCVDPVIAAAAGLGLGNVAMMLFFGAAAAPHYFLPLMLGAYVSATAWLRGHARAGEKDGSAAALFGTRGL